MPLAMRRQLTCDLNRLSPKEQMKALVGQRTEQRKAGVDADANEDRFTSVVA